MAVKRKVDGWTYEDLYDLSDDKHYEIIEGKLYEMPSPNASHVRIVMNFILLLAPYAARIGWELRTAPQGLFLPGLTNPVQPDLLLLSDLQRRAVADGGLLDDRGVVGPPALVLEVLSPSNRGHDLGTKRDIYARGGVPEYWIADPEAASVEVLVLADGSYRRFVLAEGDQAVHSLALPELSFLASAAFSV